MVSLVPRPVLSIRGPSLLIVHSCAPCLSISLPVSLSVCLCLIVCLLSVLLSIGFYILDLFACLPVCLPVSLSVWLYLPVHLFVCSAVPIGTLSAFHISFPSHHRTSIDVPLHFDGGSVESPDYKCGYKYTAGKYSSLSCSHREQVVTILSE